MAAEIRAQVRVPVAPRTSAAVKGGYSLQLILEHPTFDGSYPLAEMEAAGWGGRWRRGWARRPAHLHAKGYLHAVATQKSDSV
jgi:hypothetical protein